MYIKLQHFTLFSAYFLHDVSLAFMWHFLDITWNIITFHHILNGTDEAQNAPKCSNNYSLNAE